MFERITYISNDGCHVKLSNGGNVSTNLMNLHLIFEDNDKKILGEVDDLDGDLLKARFLGEISGNRLISGTIRKPSLDAKIRVIDQSEIPLITGSDTTGYMKLGFSPLYNNYPIFLDVNNFFSNHFAIFGNTGSGKSCGVSRLFQNMFQDQRLFPYKANIMIFDSSGEYYNAFSNLNSINPKYHYRFISTNEVEGIGEKLRLPIYLLNKDDLALLLQCTSHSQLPIIERMLKLALVFSQNDDVANAYKNHLIAKAIMTILYSNETSPNKRNEIFSILATCSTKEFNLEAPVQGIGYVRKFRECFLIDNSGNFSESVLLTEYVNSFIKDEFDNYEPKGGVFYTLDTLEKALNFTLISEGWLRNEQTYGDSVTIRVRLHALIVGENAKYFDVSEYISLESYLSSLLISNGDKYQIVNINLNDIDDEFAKVLTKIYSRMIFDFAKGLKDRASIPFHIVLEEAHRYIQSDHDRFLFGYNIFERIAKEGRKYGVMLGLISQRPVEISDTVISQCTNFLIFKINHPSDIKYIREMVPHITDEIIEKQKSLQPGTCLGFGLAFRIPLIIKMEMPNPSPLSSNCDVVRIWCGNEAKAVPNNVVDSGVSSVVSSDYNASVASPSSVVSNDYNASVASPSSVVSSDYNVSVASPSSVVSNDYNVSTVAPSIPQSLPNRLDDIDSDDYSARTNTVSLSIPVSNQSNEEDGSYTFKAHSMNELDLNSSVDTPIHDSIQVSERIPEVDEKAVISSDNAIPEMDVKPVVSSEKVIPDVSETVPLKYNYTVSTPVDSPVASPNVSLHTVSSSNMSATDTLLENSNLIGSKPSSANSSISSIGLSPIDLTLDDEDDSDTFH